MALDPTIVEDVANSNFKAVAGQLAALSNMQLQNVTSFQQALQKQMLDSSAAFGRLLHDSSGAIGAAMALLTKRTAELEPEESQAATGILDARLAHLETQLSSVVATIQQLMKGAQSTPPVTVPPPAV